MELDFFEMLPQMGEVEWELNLEVGNRLMEAFAKMGATPHRIISPHYDTIKAIWCCCANVAMGGDKKPNDATLFVFMESLKLAFYLGYQAGEKNDKRGTQKPSHRNVQ